MNEYLTYKALHGLAPPYLSDDVCWLRKSVDVCDQLFSWCTDMCGLVTGVFAVAGPRVWNSLPAPLRDTNSIYSFRKLLKTHLFSGGCRNYLFFLLLRGVQIFLLTYLLTYIWCWMRQFLCTCRYEAGRVIAKQGHRAQNFYFLLSGKGQALCDQFMTSGENIMQQCYNAFYLRPRACR